MVHIIRPLEVLSVTSATMVQWPFQCINVLLYSLVLLLNFVECCLAQFAFDEDFFAKISVGIFACFVIGFIFSVVLGFLWQVSRRNDGSKEATNGSDDNATADPSTSRVMYMDGRTVNVISLSDLEASGVAQALSNQQSKEIRESLYAEIDLTKKKSRHNLFTADRYPAVDYT